MFLEAHMVGHGAHPVEIGCLVEQQAVFETQPLAAQHLVRQGQQARIANPRLQ